MKRYLLDTHIFLWFLLDSKELASSIQEEIEYFQNIYYVSVASLQEFVILVQNNKIKTKSKLADIVKDLLKYNINILEVKPEHISTLENLSTPSYNRKKHDDPFDRLIISQGICEKMIVISADTRFPLYKDKNFVLRQNI